jgi:adenylate cyclase
MRPFIPNAVSYFTKRASAFHSAAIDSPHDDLVSGYSYLLTEDQSEMPAQRCAHRQVGILYADIVDYSRLTEQDEEGTHRHLVESMKTMEAYVCKSNGRIVHCAGDAILAEFKSAENALSCAINMQRSHHRRNACLNADRQVFFRIGVNFGGEIVDQGDIYGNAVNLAARLEKLAHSGGICVSETVKRRLNNHQSFKFIATGKQHLKNISEPVEAFWIVFDAEPMDRVDQSCSTNSSVMAL